MSPGLTNGNDASAPSEALKQVGKLPLVDEITINKINS